MKDLDHFVTNFLPSIASHRSLRSGGIFNSVEQTFITHNKGLRIKRPTPESSPDQSTVPGI